MSDDGVLGMVRYRTIVITVDTVGPDTPVKVDLGSLPPMLAAPAVYAAFRALITQPDRAMVVHGDAEIIPPIVLLNDSDNEEESP